jgi:nucleotide-binding universal stress UspA family protein
MRILVATDLSDPTLDGRATLRSASPWAVRTGAVVDALYTHDREPPPYPHDLPDEVVKLLHSAWERLDVGLKERLTAALAELPAANRGQPRVERGDAWVNLASFAPGYDLVVLTTHGRSGLERAWFGSVAERFVAASPVPTLVIHPDGPTVPATGPLKILAGLDLREDLEAQWAALAPALSRLGSFTVDGLFSQSDPVWPSGWEPTALSARITEDWLELIRVHQDRLFASMSAHLTAEQRGTAHVRGGEPAAEIVAASEDYDLVVVGTHGRTGLAHFWHGSVSEKVVRRAKAPVLVVPGMHPGRK